MEKSRERMIEAKAREDARWDRCFVDLKTLGLITNSRFGSYDPPQGAEEKALYDLHWNKEKEEGQA